MKTLFAPFFDVLAKTRLPHAKKHLFSIIFSIALIMLLQIVVFFDFEFSQEIFILFVGSILLFNLYLFALIFHAIFKFWPNTKTKWGRLILVVSLFILNVWLILYIFYLKAYKQAMLENRDH